MVKSGGVGAGTPHQGAPALPGILPLLPGNFRGSQAAQPHGTRGKGTAGTQLPCGDAGERFAPNTTGTSDSRCLPALGGNISAEELHHRVHSAHLTKSLNWSAMPVSVLLRVMLRHGARSCLHTQVCPEEPGTALKPGFRGRLGHWQLQDSTSPPGAAA